MRFISTTYIERPGAGSIKNVTVIPGTTIGPDLCKAVMDVCGAMKVPV